jgi:hypothetical protein
MAGVRWKEERMIEFERERYLSSGRDCRWPRATYLLRGRSDLDTPEGATRTVMETMGFCLKDTST